MEEADEAAQHVELRESGGGITNEGNLLMMAMRLLGECARRTKEELKQQPSST